MLSKIFALQRVIQMSRRWFKSSWRKNRPMPTYSKLWAKERRSTMSWNNKTCRRSRDFKSFRSRTTTERSLMILTQTTYEKWKPSPCKFKPSRKHRMEQSLKKQSMPDLQKSLRNWALRWTILKNAKRKSNWSVTKWEDGQLESPQRCQSSYQKRACQSALRTEPSSTSISK